jgi:hypothetical protein
MSEAEDLRAFPEEKVVSYLTCINNNGNLDRIFSRNSSRSLFSSYVKIRMKRNLSRAMKIDIRKSMASPCLLFLRLL